MILKNVIKEIKKRLESVVDSTVNATTLVNSGLNTTQAINFFQGLFNILQTVVSCQT